MPSIRPRTILARETASQFLAVAVSSDGTRVVRMGDPDITGAHGTGPHMNFEALGPNPARPGRMMVINNSHVYLIDP
jgi:hypothetical protein